MTEYAPMPFNVDDWEKIGQWGIVYGGEDLRKTPVWVLKIFRRMDREGVFFAGMREGTVPIIRGKTFRYVAIPQGQGAEGVTIYRQLRRHAQHRATEASAP